MRILVILAFLASLPAFALDVPAKIRDFQEEHPDFEDDNGAETGIVQDALGADDTPQYNGGDDGTDTTTGPDEFAQWYHDAPGVNRPFTIFLPLTENGDGTLSFESDAFFPIDNRGFGNEGEDHNFHFTTEVHLRFTYAGGETFEFDGDDDVYVFINNQLALDLGGVHAELSGDVNLDGAAAELGLTVGETYDLELFHAERKRDDSNFKLTTSLVLETVDTGDDVGDANDDGVPDDQQNLPGDGLLDLPDDDGDGVPNGCAVQGDVVSCPDGTQPDIDGDGLPDELDDDRDGDGVPNVDDDDQDGDGDPDVTDSDIDGDGVQNGDDRDADGDGVRNADDQERFGEFSEGLDPPPGGPPPPEGCTCASASTPAVAAALVALLRISTRRRR